VEGKAEEKAPTHDLDSLPERLLALLVVRNSVALREPHSAITGKVDSERIVDLDGARHG
jgi:hypothetical protein